MLFTFVLWRCLNRLEVAKTLFSLGVEKIIVNSGLISNPQEVEKIIDQFGEQAVIGSIDIGRSLFGKYQWWDYKKRKPLGSIEEAVQLLKKLRVGEVLLQDVSRDGEMSGFDLDLIKNIGDMLQVPLIVSGGAGELSDCRKAMMAGADAVAAGSL